MSQTVHTPAFAHLLPPRNVVDLRAELAGAARCLEMAASDVRSGDTRGLATMLDLAARNARAVLEKTL